MEPTDKNDPAETTEDPEEETHDQTTDYEERVETGITGIMDSSEDDDPDEEAG